MLKIEEKRSERDVQLVGLSTWNWEGKKERWLVASLYMYIKIIYQCGKHRCERYWLSGGYYLLG